MRRTSALALITWAMLSPVAVACTPQDPEALATVTDSAGIAIVLNRGPVEAEFGGWRVSDEPGLSIGTVGGDPGYQFYEVCGAVQLSGGRIAVADRGSQEIRIFDARGRILHVFGGRGDGPGEFQGLSLVGVLPGDTLVVASPPHRRLSFLHADAGFVRAVTPEGLPPGMLEVVAMFPDGRLVMRGGFHFDPQSIRDGLSRIPQVFFSANADGSGQVEYPPVPGPENWVQLGGEVVDITPLPFGRRPSIGISGNLLLMGDADLYEIRGYSADGSLTRMIRLDQEPTRLTKKDVDRWVEGRIRDADDPGLAPGIRSTYAEFPFPDHLPAFARFSTDSEGYVWVEESRLPADETPVWTIFDEAGRLSGRVTLPAGLRVWDIGKDYLLGSWRNAWDVEFVQRYRLERPNK